MEGGTQSESPLSWGAFANAELERDYLEHARKGLARRSSAVLLGASIGAACMVPIDWIKLSPQTLLPTLIARACLLALLLRGMFWFRGAKSVKHFAAMYNLLLALALVAYALVAINYYRDTGLSQHLAILTSAGAVITALHPGTPKSAWPLTFSFVIAELFISRSTGISQVNLAWNGLTVGAICMVGQAASLGFHIQARTLYEQSLRAAKAEAEVRRLKEEDARTARRALRKRDDEWDAIVRSAPVLLNIVDESHVVVFANAMATAVGLGEGANFAERVREGDSPTSPLTHTFESAQIGNFERTLWVGGEPRMYSFSVAPVGKAPVEQVTVVGIDRTEAARMSEELFQAQKQQAVGTLVGGIAHDFNNLLTVVSGNIALLAADSNLSGEDREMALEVKEAAEKAAGLTRQLLLFTRRKPQRVESLQLRDVVESLLPILTRLLGERIRLEVEVEQGLPRVLLDATQCEQILMNLVVNARDAIRDAGTVSLKIQRKAEGVELRVSDTGAGIEEGVLHHIFDPFFTTKPIGQGTGLGLATVRSITEQAGGTVEVESKPGFGTDFILTFPISQEKFSAPEESSDVRGLGRKVLFVDDDEKVLRLGVKMLEAQGYHARGCTTFSEALKVAEESELDALVTDVRLPDASGRDIAAAMRARLPGLAVVFVSGYIDDPELLDQADRGEEVVVDKPFSSRSLGEALRLAFRRSRRGSLPIRQQKPEGS